MIHTKNAYLVILTNPLRYPFNYERTERVLLLHLDKEGVSDAGLHIYYLRLDVLFLYIPASKNRKKSR
jgi:hypothetical protein